jgi:hypothetical protein
MKATRQLVSLCLVIGMTIVNYTVPSSQCNINTPITTSFVTNSSSVISPFSHSGSTSQFVNSQSTTSLYIGDDVSISVRRCVIAAITT